MRDPLLARAQLAILENRILRREGNALRDQIDDARAELRRSVFESEMQRAELKAMREDRHGGGVSWLPEQKSKVWTKRRT